MTLATIRQLGVKSEADLGQMIMENPESVEKGLHILENQVPASRGFIDILAVDSDGTRVVAELKKESSDRILTRASEYYDFIRDNSERFAQIYSDHSINPRVEPRLILVAGGYSSSVPAAARYVSIPLTLYTYVYLGIGDVRGLYLTEIDISPARAFDQQRPSVDQHVAYISDETVNSTCKDVLDWLASLDPAQITKRGLKYRVSVKYKGNNFVNISTRRNYFYVEWRPDWKRNRIATLEDFTEEIKQQVCDALSDMGGLPPDLDEATPEEDA